MFERIQHLSAAMAGGDAMAVEAFYRQYFDHLYSHARRCTGRDESFCLDVVQDAVLRVIRTVKQVDSEPRFRGWLKLVVQTTAFDLLRGEKRRKNREAMSAVAPANAQPDPDSLQLDWLADQINQLDPELVRIIEMRFDKSWTLQRIGQALGLSTGAVDGRLRRALRKLSSNGMGAPPVQDPETFSNTKGRIGVQPMPNDSPTTSALKQPEIPIGETPMILSAPAIDSPSIEEPIAPESSMGVSPMAHDSPVTPALEQLEQTIGETPMILPLPAVDSLPIEGHVAVESTMGVPPIAANSSKSPPPEDESCSLEDEAGSYDDRL